MEPYAAVVDLLQTASAASPTEEGRLDPSGPVVVTMRMRCGAGISRGQVKSSTTMTRAFGCAPLSSAPSATRADSGRERRFMRADWRSRQRGIKCPVPSAHGTAGVLAADSPQQCNRASGSISHFGAALRTRRTAWPMKGLICSSSRPKHVDAVTKLGGNANADLEVQLNSSPVSR